MIPPQQFRRKIMGLQVFRGIAALAVVMHHAVISTEAFVEPVPYIALALLKQGYLGVDFFFVLSGFIITYAHWGDAGVVSAMRRYSFKRLMRIYPAYLPISLALLLLYSLMPRFSASDHREISMASSLWLIPSAGAPALSVAWTLVHEMQFYLIFIIFFFSRRMFFISLLIWCMVIFSCQFIDISESWLRYPLSPLNVEFMFGVLAAAAIRNEIDFTPQYILFSGVLVACIALSGLIIYEVGYIRVAFALGLAMIIVGVAHIELRRDVGWSLFALSLGNASYSIYLVHNPLLSATQRAASHFGQNWLVALIAGTIISVIAGLLYHRIIERPVLKFFSAKLN